MTLCCLRYHHNMNALSGRPGPGHSRACRACRELRTRLHTQQQEVSLRNPHAARMRRGAAEGRPAPARLTCSVMPSENSSSRSSA